MITVRILPGASDMSSDARKHPRSVQNTASASGEFHRPYLAPKLAIGDKTSDNLRHSAARTNEAEVYTKSTISPNVTPRSTARRSRFGDSAPPTPEETAVSPLASRAGSTLVATAYPSVRPQRRQTTQSESGQGRNQRDSRTQFFLASDAPSKTNKSPVRQVKSRSFVYANGEEETIGTRGNENGRRLSRSPGPRPVGKQEDNHTKRRVSSRSTPAISRPYMDVKFVPAAISPPGLPKLNPDLRILSRTIRGVTPRSKSPLKKFPTSDAPKALRRRSSIDTGERDQTALPYSSQLKRESEGSSVSREQPQLDDVAAQPVLPLVALAPPFSPVKPIFSVPGSPVSRKPNEPSEEASISVADARRERKILDLEISNSSLLAFNRSLERDNRKLKAELRRYRRATNASILSQAGVSAADTSDGIMDGEIESSEDASEPESLTSSQNAEQNARDRQRLQRDFSRHKELLDDSRQMNLSIKHCLDVTDLLIAEARQAINQEIVLTEDDLRGKVLQSDDAGRDLDHSRGLLSPARESNMVWDLPLDDVNEISSITEEDPLK